jgi:hypothetical protein
MNEDRMFRPRFHLIDESKSFIYEFYIMAWIIIMILYNGIYILYLIYRYINEYIYILL